MALNQLKRKISSIRSTQKITNAMCLIATTKLKKQRKLFESLKDYFYDFYKIVNILLDGNEEFMESLLPKDYQENTLYININSSIGLCGSYNASLDSHVAKLIQPENPIVQFGKQGLDFLNVHEYPNEIIKYYNFNEKKVSYNICLDIANEIISLIKQGRFNKVKINYVQFINALTFTPITVDVIPFNKSLFEEVGQVKDNAEYEFNPNKKEILLHLLPDYIATMLYGALIESKVSEYASRRNAMDLATKNAKELSQKYLLQFNNERQAQITTEIIEIISGAMELKKDKKGV